jgi:hypothetical protein
MPDSAPIPSDGGNETVEALTELLEKPEGNAGSLGAEGRPSNPHGGEGRPNNRESQDTGAGPGKPDAQPAGGDEPTGDGPADEPVTGRESEGEGDPDSPVIAAPSSWPAEARDAFAKLPADLQKVIRERDAEQTAAFNRQVNEAAEKRKAADAELLVASQERQQYVQSLAVVVDKLIKQTAGEFADIRSPDDLERMAAQDPARFIRWQARAQALQAAGNEMQVAAERERQEQETRFNGWLGEQRSKLIQAIPELSDPAKAKSLVAEQTDYLKSIGFNTQEIGSVLDHRMAVVIRDAAAHRKSQAAAKTATAKKIADAPKLARPGGGGERGRDPARAAAFTSIARHGSSDQQAEALARMIEGN